MLKLLSFVALLGALGVYSQEPKPCIAPVQLHFRMNVFEHARDIFNKFTVSYDATNRRSVWFEEENVVIPGKRFFEYLILNDENVMYKVDLNSKVCTKSESGPFRPIAIHTNATFEDEFYFGGPGEAVFATEWSDRVPFRKREFWIGVFSMKDCYPVRESYITNGNITATTTIDYYDIVDGIPNPDVFIPPAECNAAFYEEPEDFPLTFL